MVAYRFFISLEYIRVGVFFDQPKHARELIELVRTVPCKFNLITFNPFPDSDLKRPERETVLAFAKILNDAGIVTTIRKTRGDDIDAACGQLAGEVKDRTRRAERLRVLTRAFGILPGQQRCPTRRFPCPRTKVLTPFGTPDARRMPSRFKTATSP